MKAFLLLILLGGIVPIIAYELGHARHVAIAYAVIGAACLVLYPILRKRTITTQGGRDADDSQQGDEESLPDAR